jgi:phosphate-selective porin OprO and OprP
VFTDAVSDDFGDATKDFGRLVGRLTGLPLYELEPDHPESQRLLHLGLNGTVLYAGDTTVRYRTRPESHLAPYVVDTGEIAANAAYTFDVEAAWVHGPLCLQGEFLHSRVQSADGPERDFYGLYASASWFLTGESRPYDQNHGTFGRVAPRKNFNIREGGWGAWEVAGRFSYVDLNSGDISGGRMSVLMAGVNWYLHSQIKWRFNYGFGRVTERDPDGHLNIFQTRLEIDF